MTDPVKYEPHFCECGKKTEKILAMAKELVTMPINFSELRLQLMFALDEHDKLVKGEG